MRPAGVVGLRADVGVGDGPRHDADVALADLRLPLASRNLNEGPPPLDGC
jgi:hypothetical protein